MVEYEPIETFEDWIALPISEREARVMAEMERLLEPPRD